MRNNADRAPHYYDDNAEVIMFFKTIWHYQSPEAKCFTIWWKELPREDKGRSGYKHFCVNEYNSFEDMLHAVARYVATYRPWERVNIYFQVLPLSRKPESGRGKAQDVKVGKVLFADFDYKKKVDVNEVKEEKCHEGEDHSLDCYYAEDDGTWHHVKRPSLKEFLAEIGKIAEPAIITDSGAGYHVYFLLDQEVEAEKLSKLQNMLVSLLPEADQHVKDLSRVLRVPTTFNPKIKRMCRVIYISDKRYSYDELLQRLTALSQAQRPLEPQEAPEELQEARQADEKKPRPRLRKIAPKDVRRIIQLLEPYYEHDHRQDLLLFLAGWAATLKIDPVDIAFIIRELHELKSDRDPLSQRLDTLAYSYPKVGISLAPYAEEIERITGTKIRIIDPEDIGVVKVRGKESLLRHLEKILVNVHNKPPEEAREIALATIHELSKLLGGASPYSADPIIIMIDELRKQYAVIDFERKLMGLAYIKDGETEGIKLSPIVARVVPVKIIEYVNPLTRKVTVEAWFDGEDLAEPLRPLKLEAMEINSIAKELATYPSTGISGGSEELFTKILHHLIGPLRKRKIVETKIVIPNPGIYVIDRSLLGEGEGKELVVSDREVKEVDKERLRRGLEFLNMLAGMYTPHKFSTCMKWGAIAAFGFARKQLGGWVRSLFLHGPPDAGKTTLGRIILAIWNLKSLVFAGRTDELFELTGSSGDTVAKLGSAYQKGTYPVLFNEADPILNNESVALLFRGAIDNLVARTVITDYKHARGIHFPSLSTLMLTANKPITEFITDKNLAPLMKRLIMITFTDDEVPPPEKRAYFETEIVPQFDQLPEIGNCILYVALKWGIPFLSKKVPELQLGKELLEECYRMADMPVPAWLNLEYTYDDSIIHEITLPHVFRTRARQHILKIYSEHYIRASPDGAEIGVYGKIVKAVTQNLVPGLEYVKYESGEYVGITREFLDKIGLKDIGLPTLAKAMGWDYDWMWIPIKDDAQQVLENGKKKKYYKVRAVKVKANDFFSFLGSEAKTAEKMANVKEEVASAQFNIVEVEEKE